jgi:serine phosphatase RsbU (regulator of sigma subunit)
VLSGAELGVAPTRIRVDASDDVLVYSDGLSECTDAAGQLFGVERIAAAMSGSPSDAGFEAVMREVASFRGDEQVKDDLSALCVSVGRARSGAPVPDDSGSQGSLASAESSQR